LMKPLEYAIGQAQYQNAMMRPLMWNQLMDQLVKIMNVMIVMEE